MDEIKEGKMVGRFKRSQIERKMDEWSTAAAYLEDSHLAVFSYEKDRIIYLRIGEEEIVEDALIKNISTLNEKRTVVPFVPPEHFYPFLVIKGLVGMREDIDRHNRRAGTLEAVNSKSMWVKGIRYMLMAWTTHTERYGKICVFTGHIYSRKDSRIKENKEWHRVLLANWYENRLKAPDWDYWHDAMWCTDVRGKTVEEIVNQNAKNTPVGHEPISDILSAVMQPGVLEASEVRTGYPPVCLSALKVPTLDLIFVQRFRLIGRDENK